MQWRKTHIYHGIIMMWHKNGNIYLYSLFFVKPWFINIEIRDSGLMSCFVLLPLSCFPWRIGTQVAVWWWWWWLLKRVKRAYVLCECQFRFLDTQTLFLMMLKEVETRPKYNSPQSVDTMSICFSTRWTTSSLSLKWYHLGLRHFDTSSPMRHSREWVEWSNSK
jgi:hypothetical protein